MTAVASHSPPVDRVDVLRRLAEAVNSTLERREVLRNLAELALEATGADRCAVFLDEGDRLSPQVALARIADADLWERFRSMGPIRLDAGHLHLVSAGRAVTIEDARHDPLIPAVWVDGFDLRAVVLAPIHAAGSRCGLLTLDWPEARSIPAYEVELVETIAGYAGLAVRNAELFEAERRLVRELELRSHRLACLHDVANACTAGADAAAVACRLGRMLMTEGITVDQIALRDPRLRRRFGGSPPNAEERPLWRERLPVIHLSGGGVAVALRVGRRCLGSLRLGSEPVDTDQRSFLIALAAGLAETLERHALRADIERSERERAVLEERERLGQDLHDTASQVFVAIGLLANHDADVAPTDSRAAARNRRIAQLADEGRQQVDAAVRAMAFAPAGRRSLARSLRGLTQAITADSNLDIRFTVEGTPARLAPSHEQALYRVANEALINAWRHARCAFIGMEIRFERDEVVLSITDDGIGLDHRHAGASHLGIDGMRRAMTSVDGSLHIRNGQPRGVMVQALVTRRLHKLGALR